jgi:hypothetical protein
MRSTRGASSTVWSEEGSVARRNNSPSSVLIQQEWGAEKFDHKFLDEDIVQGIEPWAASS